MQRRITPNTDQMRGRSGQSPGQPQGYEEVALAFRRVEKRFGATIALRDLDLDVRTGTVHGLVGENGAGKSTCLGLAAGRLAPSRGTVEAFGQPLAAGQPRRAREAGIAAIYQELTIVPAMTAEANVFLGASLTQSLRLSARVMRQEYVRHAELLGVRAWPGVRAGNLSVADQQLLEILRAIVKDARIILFDEPSAALAPAEKEVLFEAVEGLKQAGVTMMFVSHDLDEVLRIADDVTVFRDGMLRASAPARDWTKPSLVDAMLGRSLAPIAKARASEPRSTSRATAPVVRVEGLSVSGALTEMEFEIHAGEVVGIAGLMGSGRTTLLRALAGLEPVASGRLWVDGRECSWPKSPRQARRLGLALMPEDRKNQGLAMQMSAAANIALSSIEAVSQYGRLSHRRIRVAVEEVAEQAGLSKSMLDRKAAELSGGNQQKLLVARWLLSRPRVLLCDEPTRGVDIGAKAEILRALEALATAGVGVAMVSSDLEDIEAAANRVVVLAKGRQVGMLHKATDDTSPDAILRLAFQVSDRHLATVATEPQLIGRPS
jgi:ABC-type sugar transport system ATPase subunit